MKILFTTLEFFPYINSGAGVYAYELTKSLVNSGVEMHILTPGKKTETTKKNSKLYIHWREVTQKPPWRWFSMMSTFRKSAGSIISKYDIDLIHSNDIVGASIRSKLPIITTIHHPAINDYNSIDSVISKLFIRLYVLKWEKILIKKCKKQVCVSHINKKLFEKEYPSFKEKMVVIREGIDTQRFRFIKNSKVKHDYGISEKDILLFHPGGGRSERKGTFDLLDALEKLNGRYNVKCIISGESREAGWNRRLLKEIARKKLNNIILTGELAFKELPYYYSGADIVVFPSIFEGYGLPPLEAMACEKPVITTKVGELPNIIRNNENGILIDVGDVDSLTRSIEKLIKNKELRQSLGRRGRDYIRENLSWNEITEEIVNLYSSVV